MLTLSCTASLVNPAVLPCPAVSPDRYTIREVWIAGFDLGLAGAPLVIPSDLTGVLADEFHNGHWSGWDSCPANRLDHSAADEAEDLAYRLASDGDFARCGSRDDADRLEREAEMARYFQQLDWEHEFEMEQREIEKLNRELGGWDRAGNLALV